jgi:hypothetical protein
VKEVKNVPLDVPMKELTPFGLSWRQWLTLPQNATMKDPMGFSKKGRSIGRAGGY